MAGKALRLLLIESVFGRASLQFGKYKRRTEGEVVSAVEPGGFDLISRMLNLPKNNVKDLSLSINHSCKAKKRPLNA